MKVYFWATTRGPTQAAHVVAAKTRKAAYALGAPTKCVEARPENPGSAVALAEPGVVFWRPLQERSAPWSKAGAAAPEEPPVPAWVKDGYREAWRLSFGNRIEICVHRLLGVPAAWFVTCHEVHVTRRLLGSSDVALAQQEAFAIVANILRGWRVEMERYMAAKTGEA